MMKKQFFLFTLLCSIGAMQAQQFVKVGGSATDIAINPKNGKVFVVSNKNIFQDYNYNTKKWRYFGPRMNDAKSIAIDRSGKIFKTTIANTVLSSRDGYWKKYNSLKSSEINVGMDGTITAIDLAKKSKYLNNGVWKTPAVRSYNPSNGLSQVLVINNNEHYSRDGSGYFQHWKSGRWQKLNGQPNKIALDHKNGDVYAVGRNKGIYKWNKRTNKWILLANTRKDFVDLAVHNGVVWGVTTNKSIYQCDTKKGVSYYEGTYRVTITRRLRVDTPIIPDFFGVAGVRLQNRKGGRLITINPERGQSPRFIDIPKNNMAKVRRLSKPVYERNLESAGYNRLFKWYYTINQTREFVLSRQDADANAEFKFEFNIRENGFNIEELGKWYSYVLPLRDIKFGKEYISYPSEICFKIEKI